jgi:anthranilate phosphoribosyltransferase
VGIGFLFAPLLHPAMKHAVLPRREVGLKSIFNLLGPLANPAGADVQVVGVYRADLVEIMAEALRRLGARGAAVVYGEDGVDEISISGPTIMARLQNGEITVSRIGPEDVGLPRAPRESVVGGDALVNAGITLDVLKGRPGPRRDMVLLNAAAALLAAETVRDLKQGVLESAESIDSGRALAKLEALVEIADRLAPVREAVVAGGRP